MSDEWKITDWRMTEETLPERPDDREWRKAMALGLFPFAALAVMLLGFIFLKASVGLIVADVLIGAVMVVNVYAHSRRSP